MAFSSRRMNKKEVADVQIVDAVQSRSQLNIDILFVYPDYSIYIWYRKRNKA
jgi:hypothetical protein